MISPCLSFLLCRFSCADAMMNRLMYSLRRNNGSLAPNWNFVLANLTNARPGTVFVPNLLQDLESRSTKLRVYKMENTGHEKKTWGKQVLERRFYFSYFTHYIVVDNQGGQRFIQTFSLRPNVLISNNCMCVS